MTETFKLTYATMFNPPRNSTRAKTKCWQKPGQTWGRNMA